jgi:acetylglutamate kinase
VQSERAKIVEALIEAFPYIKRFEKKYFVIKYGGAAMVDEHLKDAFAVDCVLLRYVGIKPVIVHGGGPKINEVMKKMGRKIRFIDGLRLTDSEDMECVEMVLGKITSDIVNLLNKHGARAIGLSGVDSAMIRVRPIEGMGYVGEIERVDPELIKLQDDAGFVPVIAPIGVDNSATLNKCNVNADTAAAEIAVALSAEKLIILTDIEGIMKKGKVLSTVRAEDIDGLIEEGVIKSGMIPKARAAKSAVLAGVKKAHIIDGRIPHSILLEIFTDEGIGTEVTE